MQNLKLTVEYDGTDFKGWQIQPDKRTVQEVLEEAITKITGHTTRVIGAGRTDAGVHASGQVCNFLTESSLSFDKMLRSLNGILPKDVVVRNIELVDDNFNARFQAKKRVYRYIVTQRRRAINQRYMWYYPHPLNIMKMKEASECLSGEHDCKSFGCSGSDEKSTLCLIEYARWEEQGDQLHFIIASNRFLRKMVRSLVGTLIEVGKEKCSVEGFRKIIEAKDRRCGGNTVPPCGLFLEVVYY